MEMEKTTASIIRALSDPVLPDMTRCVSSQINDLCRCFRTFNEKHQMYEYMEVEIKQMCLRNNYLPVPVITATEGAVLGSSHSGLNTLE
jgi:hypothetical protein